MTILVAAAVVLGLVTTGSGWFVWQSHRARVAAAALVVSGVLLLLGSAFVLLDVGDVAELVFLLVACLTLPVAVVAYPRLEWRDPLSFVLVVVVLGGGLLAALWEAAFEPLAFAVAGAVLVHAWWAFERGSTEDRRALAWTTLAWTAAGLVIGFVTFLEESLDTDGGTDIEWLFVSALVLGPVAMAVGVVRPEVVDVRGLVTRAVVSTTVFLAYLAVAVGIVSATELASGRPLAPTPVVIVCALLAFGVRPLQVLLRGVVDQLLFGDRPDPLTAATSVADRIGEDPALALAAVREALVLPYASIRAGGEVLASSGTAVTHTRVLPLRLGEDEVGEVVVGLRAGDLSLSSADEDVLRIVAPLLAQTLRAQAMSRDLRESREATVTAVEEERRRLRRDLHDGLGPTLSGVAFATDAARNQLRADPDRADALLVGLRTDTAAAIAEIRRLVEGLRPPALDQLGLVGAVRQHAATLHSSSGTPLTVAVDVDDHLPALSAATEVAAYRIVVEALTNAARHAAATTARVELCVRDGALVLDVRDDGRSSTEWTPGVGISSMRERALQVGGTLSATATADGGLVVASLPLGPAAS
ncbi:two-component sensor histidine kinase [Nocardioides glacieisoli]|uniref:histidine kinase n=1 Tax=Nocardioides glacieisoli TaxID=1168730 RepID=A0A4Q2RKY6_9ACTN|nr:histidine kinase [Nocardioides glacieisoli]RYB89421.1 two-component sensor histidine kinase [Nocardioides glacieisoli]